MSKWDFLSKVIWMQLDQLGTDNTCADNEALFIEVDQKAISKEKGFRVCKYYKLVPVEVTREEFDAAWDRSSEDT